jgi:hypothetical protein
MQLTDTEGRAVHIRPADVGMLRAGPGDGEVEIFLDFDIAITVVDDIDRLITECWFG